MLLHDLGLSVVVYFLPFVIFFCEMKINYKSEMNAIHTLMDERMKK